MMFDQKQYYIRNKDVGTLVLLNETLYRGTIDGMDDPDTLDELSDLQAKLDDLLANINQKPLTSSPAKVVM